MAHHNMEDQTVFMMFPDYFLKIGMNYLHTCTSAVHVTLDIKQYGSFSRVCIKSDARHQKYRL